MFKLNPITTDGKELNFSLLLIWHEDKQEYVDHIMKFLNKLKKENKKKYNQIFSFFKLSKDHKNGYLGNIEKFRKLQNANEICEIKSKPIRILCFFLDNKKDHLILINALKKKDDSYKVEGKKKLEYAKYIKEQF